MFNNSLIFFNNRYIFSIAKNERRANDRGKPLRNQWPCHFLREDIRPSVERSAALPGESDVLLPKIEFVAKVGRSVARRSAFAGYSSSRSGGGRAPGRMFLFAPLIFP